LLACLLIALVAAFGVITRDLAKQSFRRTIECQLSINGANGVRVNLPPMATLLESVPEKTRKGGEAFPGAGALGWD